MQNKTNVNSKKLIEIKPYNVKELAAIYGVDRRIMSGWLKEHRNAIGKKTGQLFTVLQVEIIFELLGLPSQKELDD